MNVLAIDPGTSQSAWLLLVDGTPADFGLEPNEVVAQRLRIKHPHADVVVIERVESYGMAVGRETFETVRWEGKFAEAARPLRVVELPRRAVKLAICASPKANDSNIRAALLDRFGGAAAGKKGGALAGIVKDTWSALAIAVTYHDQVAP